MDINGFEKVVQRYLAGQATDEDLLLIEQWLQETEANNYQLTEERKKIITGRLLPRLHAITHPNAATPARSTHPFRRFSGRFVRIAAAVIMVAGTGGLGWIFRYQIAERIAPVPQQTVKAGPYEIKRVQLPDHTLVTLNTGAAIRFPVRYRGNKRIATLQGEAFFEVAKDDEKPFVVHTNSLDVTVMGTSFVITDQQTFASVSVVTGKVKVAADAQSVTVLKPGLQVYYNKQSGKSDLRSFDIQQLTAWTQHSFSFSEVPLEQVLQAIAQKWHVRFILPAVASGKAFSGDFSNDDSLNDTMTALALATGIRWERSAAGEIRITYP